MLRPLKITFNLDGTGIYYNPHEPMHLDALLSWALMPFHRQKGDEAPTRDSKPIDVPLPLGKWHIGGEWGWCASALFPDGENCESLQFWRKRFRQNKIEQAKGNPVLTNGVYREYNNPMPLLLTQKMTCYALGSKKRVKQILKKHIKFLGKKSSIGKGRIISIDIDIIDEDYSLTKDGYAMRFLPLKDGFRRCRVRPPYWNNHKKTNVCEVGEPYSIKKEKSYE